MPKCSTLEETETDRNHIGTQLVVVSLAVAKMVVLVMPQWTTGLPAAAVKTW